MGYEDYVSDPNAPFIHRIKHAGGFALNIVACGMYGALAGAAEGAISGARDGIDYVRNNYRFQKDLVEIEGYINDPANHSQPK